MRKYRQYSTVSGMMPMCTLDNKKKAESRFQFVQSDCQTNGMDFAKANSAY